MQHVEGTASITCIDDDPVEDIDQARRMPAGDMHTESPAGCNLSTLLLFTQAFLVLQTSLEK